MVLWLEGEWKLEEEMRKLEKRMVRRGQPAKVRLLLGQVQAPPPSTSTQAVGLKGEHTRHTPNNAQNPKHLTQHLRHSANRPDPPKYKSIYYIHSHMLFPCPSSHPVLRIFYSSIPSLNHYPIMPASTTSITIYHISHNLITL